jgi:hypothetical protein
VFIAGASTSHGAGSTNPNTNGQMALACSPTLSPAAGRAEQPVRLADELLDAHLESEHPSHRFDVRYVA